METIPRIQQRCEQQYIHQAQEAVQLERSLKDARSKAERQAKQEIEKTKRMTEDILLRHPQVHDWLMKRFLCSKPMLTA